MSYPTSAPSQVTEWKIEPLGFFASSKYHLDLARGQGDGEARQQMRVHPCRFAGCERETIDAHAFVFKDRLAIGLARLRGNARRTQRRLEKFDRQVMKRRRSHIHRAMHISRFAKLHVAKIPFDL